MRFPQILVVFALFLMCTATSCFNDTDFEQADDVVVSPVIELDLIYFDINASQFYNTNTNTPNLVVRDTTAIEFIEGSDIRDILTRADFLFKFTNTIPQGFSINFDFLSQNNDLQYASSTQVNAGSFDTPVKTIFIDTLLGDDITNLTFSNKVVISVTIPSSTASISGNLNLQSKATYFLEID